jgi:hypothetical protein
MISNDPVNLFSFLSTLKKGARMLRFLLLFFFLTSTVTASAETLISGTFRKGSPNITEPKPEKSKYLKTVIGGVGVSGDQVRYVLNVEITKPFKRPMSIKVEFDNPQGAPFIDEAEIPAGQRVLQLTHGPVKGLKVHELYKIKVSLYEAGDRAKPVDVLTQQIVSYADTTGDAVTYQTAQPKPEKKKKR